MTMEEKNGKITILYTHLRNLTFNSLTNRDFKYERQDIEDTELDVDITFQPAEKPYHYNANATCTLRPHLKGDKYPFVIFAEYDIGVSLVDTECEEEAILNRLRSAVGDEAYRNLRVRAWEVTHTSSYPAFIPKTYKECQEEVIHLSDDVDDEMIEGKYDGEVKDEVENEELEARTEDDDCNKSDDIDEPLTSDFDKLLDDFIFNSLNELSDSDDNDDEDDNAPFKSAIMNIAENDTAPFRQTLAYRYYYRFFVPIEYHHPSFSEYSATFWDSLFQLLFGTDSNANIVTNEEGIAELEFEDAIMGRRRVSSLDKEELVVALANVSMRAIQEYDDSVLSLFCKMENIDVDNISNPPLWHEYRNIFTYPDGIITEWREREAYKFFQSIRRCDDETFTYRLAYFEKEIPF